jgi:hypothetical protein
MMRVLWNRVVTLFTPDEVPLRRDQRGRSLFRSSRRPRISGIRGDDLNAKMRGLGPMPFEVKHMVSGGFKILVDA